jgi:CheY-like chemotaxis protein
MRFMLNECQILVVDDDVEDHLILQDHFSEKGYKHKVKYLENGKQAIQFLDSIPDGATLPSLIVLDLNMPILNGSQTLLHLKQTARYRNIPVIIFSTSENDTEKRKCLSLGAIDYMVKPITLEECQETIKKFSSFIK